MLLFSQLALVGLLHTDVNKMNYFKHSYPRHKKVKVTKTKPIQEYKIKPGDTLGKIAYEYETTVDHLRNLNSIKGSLIISGHKLLVDSPRTRIYTDAKQPSTAPVHKSVKPSVQTKQVKRKMVETGNTVSLVATAYTASGGINGGTKTASGTKPVAGRTIAASASYPFGTKIRINGRVYTVEDRGGSITNNRIDIFMDSQKEAINFGRQTIKAEVLD